jgi:hypothetical protein
MDNARPIELQCRVLRRRAWPEKFILSDSGRKWLIASNAMELDHYRPSTAKRSVGPGGGFPAEKLQ